MTQLNFLDSITTIPLAANSIQAAQGHEDFSKALATLTSTENAPTGYVTLSKAVLDHPKTTPVLDALFGNSPFLTWCVLCDPQYAIDLIAFGPDQAYESTLKILKDKHKETLNTDIAKALRVARRQIALAIALGDITGLWPLKKVTGAISEFADAALSLAATTVLRQAAQDGAIEITDEDNPQHQSGLVILGMGKLGARELNYSSDIDLIVLFNPDIVKTNQPDRLQKNFIRMTRNFVKLIDDRTVDGYVFRTDLRLRPDPGATPIAMSTYAAETYYESIGQNWERAAMIKARPVAGDIEAGYDFLKWLTPFIWRKYLDFAAIQDIHSIKRQINAHKGGRSLDIPGNNIKLGPGGIREVEFYAQTQQLIWGGKEPRLRSSVTLEALRALAKFGLCDPRTVEELSQAYIYLRTLEHRLQMINDEQTQTLPLDDDGLLHLAVFMGTPNLDAFTAELGSHLKCVQDHYARLFAEAPSLAASKEIGGNLAFTGSDTDPDTLNTISGFGFKNPETVDHTIRGWHHGRYRSMRSVRAREILTELTPTLLEAISETPEPDQTFLRIDEFLQGLPAGVQLFSMFKSHPELLRLVAEIMGKAPRLGRHLAGRPSVLDSVLALDFFGQPPDKEMMVEELTRMLDHAEYEEDLLNISRRWAHDRRFQVGVQHLKRLIDAPAASAVLSDIAETVLSCLYPRVESYFADKHGYVPGASSAVLAFGKLGSREMTTTSDLDLVFIYSAPDLSAASDGDKPLNVPQYFARFGQRYINALTALTPEGRLYEVDMRLRPSGNSGPIATTLEAFKKYQIESAWTWEHMAMTRARVVAGDPEFGTTIQSELVSLLLRPRDPDTLLRDVAHMRKRLNNDKPAKSLWALKHHRGGIVDIEFITQYLSLRHAHDCPEILSTNTTAALEALAKNGFLKDADMCHLINTLALLHRLQSMLSLTTDDDMTPAHEDGMSPALKDSLVHIGKVDDFTELEEKVRQSTSLVFEIFNELIDQPAGKLAPTDTQ
jgi:glutamate-ammonia-ligase adenylyltransferase